VQVIRNAPPQDRPTGSRAGVIALGELHSVSVVHQLTDITERRCRDLTGTIGSCPENAAQVGRVLGELPPALPERAQSFVDGVGQQSLEPGSAGISDFGRDVLG